MKNILLAFLALLAFPLAASSANLQGTEQFRKFAKAIEAFHEEYGQFPKIFDDNGSFTFKTPGNTEKFVEALCGHDWEVKKIARYGNDRSLTFYRISDADFSREATRQIIDSFGNSDITIVVDTDNDGNVEIREAVGVSTLPGMVHIYSRYEDGSLAISTWSGVQEDRNSGLMVSFNVVLYTILTIALFTGWFHIRNKIIGATVD